VQLQRAILEEHSHLAEFESSELAQVRHRLFYAQRTFWPRHDKDVVDVAVRHLLHLPVAAMCPAQHCEQGLFPGVGGDKLPQGAFIERGTFIFFLCVCFVSPPKHQAHSSCGSTH